ncbi:co-chaperone GroES [Candidatus Woesearchaeota archaeon]|nr:co-chaperone GroES [Candidatus Woesearchaeota archaeon]
MKIQPLGERVLLKPKKEEKTAGGIYLPDSAKEEKKQGIVVAVGMFKDGKELPLKAGDEVLYGGYSSEEFEIHGEKHLMVEFKDVIAKVTL